MTVTVGQSFPQRVEWRLCEFSLFLGKAADECEHAHCAGSARRAWSAWEGGFHGSDVQRLSFSFNCTVDQRMGR
jgi:hypothetical protein